MVKKIVAWDFDGPINYTGRYKNNRTKVIYSESRPANFEGDFPYDIIVSNVDFLDLTLKILADNDVQSVLASQRILFPDDANYGPRTRDMYNALDQLFGQDRKFLTKNVGEEIGHPLRNVDTQKTKVPILAAIKNKYQRRKNTNIILIDDLADAYKATTEHAGYQFIHAPRDFRDTHFNGYQDSSYLYQVLFQTVRVPDIYRSIAKMPQTPVIQTFKKCLMHYQLDNLMGVCDAQVELIKEERPSYERPVDRNINAAELAAKDILTGIQTTIFDTKWDIGYFGGEKVTDNFSGLTNIIPKNMRYMLNEIEKAKHGNVSWLEVLKAVDEHGKAANAKKHSYFNQRGETTQLFYDSFHSKNYVGMVLQKSSVLLDNDGLEPASNHVPPQSVR
jgi:hypothetical protein